MKCYISGPRASATPWVVVTGCVTLTEAMIRFPGCPSQSSQLNIRKAYRKLILRTHLEAMLVFTPYQPLPWWRSGDTQREGQISNLSSHSHKRRNYFSDCPRRRPAVCFMFLRFLYNAGTQSDNTFISGRFCGCVHHDKSHHSSVECVVNTSILIGMMRKLLRNYYCRQPIYNKRFLFPSPSNSTLHLTLALSFLPSSLLFLALVLFASTSLAS